MRKDIHSIYEMLYEGTRKARETTAKTIGIFKK
jgi:hypothetical protein